MNTASELISINRCNLDKYAIAVLAAFSAVSTPTFAADDSSPSGLQLIGVAEDGGLVVSQITSSLQIPSNTVLRSLETADGPTSTNGVSSSSIRTKTAKGKLGTSIQGISGSGLQGISGSGLQGISGSGLQGISGSGLQGISGSGLQGISGSGLQGISGSGLQGISGSGLQGISGSGLQSLIATSTDNLPSSSHGTHNLLALGVISSKQGRGNEIVVVGQSISVDRSSVALEIKPGSHANTWQTIDRSELRAGQYVAVLGNPDSTMTAHAEMILVLPIQYAEGSTPIYVRGFVTESQNSVGFARIGSAAIDLTRTLSSGKPEPIGTDVLIEVFGVAFDASYSGAGRTTVSATTVAIVK